MRNMINKQYIQNVRWREIIEEEREEQADNHSDKAVRKGPSEKETLGLDLKK